ncbi:MAG: signal peptidase I [candidate division NC10 bacterium]|nr:signal peptidase I [candidate division NC10 bacterium]MBI2455109.1 signal peptidase I [candidate division NC10 bacterium]
MEEHVETPIHGQRERIWEWVKSIGLAVLLALGIRTAVVEAFVIPSGSMEPTLQVGDRVLGNKFWFWFAQPHRKDIVIFSPPASAQLAAGALIKRVIAVEGDVVEVRDGQVLVNGKPVTESYLKERPQYTLPPTKVPQGMLFVLGDNRNASYDSHAWGFVPRSHLKAKAFARYWPLNRIGLLQ